MKAPARIKEKRCRRFSTSDLSEANPSNAPLATSAEREVPRATCNEREARSSPRRIYERVDKRKTHQRFSPHDFPAAGMPPEASAAKMRHGVHTVR